MFSFVDSRTVLLLVASQVVLLSLVRCQEEDDRKLYIHISYFLLAKNLDCNPYFLPFQYLFVVSEYLWNECQQTGLCFICALLVVNFYYGAKFKLSGKTSRL